MTPLRDPFILLSFPIPFVSCKSSAGYLRIAFGFPIEVGVWNSTAELSMPFLNLTLGLNFSMNLSHYKEVSLLYD